LTGLDSWALLVLVDNDGLVAMVSGTGRKPRSKPTCNLVGLGLDRILELDLRRVHEARVEDRAVLGLQT
jgi:hypothetical protein